MKKSLRKYIQKIVLSALFVSLLSVLSVTAVEAAPAAGCSPEVWTIQSNQSQAMRVRDKAYSMSIIKRNDPAAGVTCLDKAMTVTARLGNIFSDVPGTVSGIVNTSVFSGGAGDTAQSLLKMFTGGPGNSGSLLINNLNSVVSPVLGGFLGNFTGTLTDLGGLGTAFGAALSTATATVDTILAGVTTAVNSVTGPISTVLGYINTIETIANQLGTALPQTVVLAVTASLRAVQSAVNAALAAATFAINAAMTAVMNLVKNFLSTGVNLACNNVKSLWDDGDPTNGMKSIEGSGIEDGTPYFAYEDLLAPGGPPGAGPDMKDELDNPFNVTVLAAALTDLNTKLNVPCGGLKTWKRAPVIPVNANLQAIIGMMADPCP